MKLFALSITALIVGSGFASADSPQLPDRVEQPTVPLIQRLPKERGNSGPNINLTKLASLELLPPLTRSRSFESESDFEMEADFEADFGLEDAGWPMVDEPDLPSIEDTRELEASENDALVMLEDAVAPIESENESDLDILTENPAATIECDGMEVETLDQLRFNSSDNTDDNLESLLNGGTSATNEGDPDVMALLLGAGASPENTIPENFDGTWFGNPEVSTLVDGTEIRHAYRYRDGEEPDRAQLLYMPNGTTYAMIRWGAGSDLSTTLLFGEQAADGTRSMIVTEIDPIQSEVTQVFWIIADPEDEASRDPLSLYETGDARPLRQKTYHFKERDGELPSRGPAETDREFGLPLELEPVTNPGGWWHLASEELGHLDTGSETVQPAVEFPPISEAELVSDDEIGAIDVQSATSE